MPEFIYNYWIVLAITLALSLGASLYVKIMFAKYSKVEAGHRITADQFAQWVTRHNDVDDVYVQHISGNLTDNYNPRSNTISLSDSTYGKSNIAAIGVAAHEAGHAVQYGKNFLPVKLRTLMVPVVNIGSHLGLILIILGAVINFSQSNTMIDVGIALYSLTFLFTLVTLPVEINASRRAIAAANDYQYFTHDEISGMRKVLTAAALTYVASMITALLHLLRIMAIFGRRRR